MRAFFLDLLTCKTRRDDATFLTNHPRLLPSSFLSVTEGILSPSPLKAVNENKERRVKAKNIFFISRNVSLKIAFFYSQELVLFVILSSLTIVMNRSNLVRLFVS
jgi:hypothetical protein